MGLTDIDGNPIASEESINAQETTELLAAWEEYEKFDRKSQFVMFSALINLLFAHDPNAWEQFMTIVNELGNILDRAEVVAKEAGIA